MGAFGAMLPTSYAEADRFAGTGKQGRWDDRIKLRRETDNSVVLRYENLDLVRWRGDGSLRISTWGNHSERIIKVINACLPSGYKMARQPGKDSALPHLTLTSPSGRRIARFLTGTTFTPESACQQFAAPGILLPFGRDGRAELYH